MTLNTLRARPDGGHDREEGTDPVTLQKPEPKVCRANEPETWTLGDVLRRWWEGEAKLIDEMDRARLDSVKRIIPIKEEL